RRRTSRPRCHRARRRPPAATPFPYTTLFRSDAVEPARDGSQLAAEKHLADEQPHQRYRQNLAEHFGDGSGQRPKCQRFLAFSGIDRKSTRLNSSHVKTSYAVFCSKTKTRAPP